MEQCLDESMHQQLLLVKTILTMEESALIDVLCGDLDNFNVLEARSVPKWLDSTPIRHLCLFPPIRHIFDTDSTSNRHRFVCGVSDATRR